MNLIRRSPQFNFEVAYPTVFCRVMQGFLQNSEEAKRNVRRQRDWQIVDFAVNLHFLLLAEFSAEASHGRSDTQVLQSRRVQLVRQGLNIGRYLGGSLLQFAYAAS